MKKIILSIFIILAVSCISYFYYIKPQREYIKINTQECIRKAMDPINTEVGKGPYSPHYDDGWFFAPLKTQESELEKCTDLYNTIVFSQPEKNILELSTNSLLDAQASKINIYKKEYADIKSKKQKDQAEINRCNDLRIKYDKYNKCISNSINNNYPSNNCVSPQTNINDAFGCAMIGINF